MNNASYKDKLNLPRTDFPMRAELVAREPQRLSKWESMKLYERIQSARSSGPRFVLHDGPPFANGDVHIGTALNKILKDFIVKYKTMRGFRAPYIPGWDCHGLPIEFKVSQEMRRSHQPAPDPVQLRHSCEQYARKYIEVQRTQFKRLGVLGDWERPYLTLEKQFEADELRLFADLVEKGYVYRGKKPVYWSIPCRTALAEAEVEYQDHVSPSIYVKFPIVDRPGTFLLIWTTTPWTLPANLAVAYNSTFSYSLVRVFKDDETSEDYVLSAMLLDSVAAKLGWSNYQIIRSLDGGHFEHVTYQHPFCNRTGKMYPGDEFVDNQTGTGFVHIAPGHGLEDYHLGQRVGLPVYSPVDDDGRLALTDDLPREQQMPAEMLGKSILEKHGRSEANDAVLKELSERNLLLLREDYTHSYPHCWRSKTPVIFRAMDQWFIEIDHDNFRKKALAEIDRVHWIPEWGVNRIKGAVESRPDWCISRQRCWGVPLPAFYDARNQPILDASVVRRVADLIEQHGSNIWFDTPAVELWKKVRPADWSGPEAVAKSNDTLDVWIDSGSTSRTVLMRRPELLQGGDAKLPENWQADVYLEGSDQHRGWFQSSLLLSLASHGAAPFKTVLTHGFMVDADREKISKSKQGQGGYVKPQTAEQYVKDHGADVVRLWVASQDYRNDIVVSDERIRKVGETYRLIRNALRFELSNLFDFDPEKHAVPDEQLTDLDRWILHELSQLEEQVIQAYERFEFHIVYQRISQFAAVELSAIYHDAVKDRYTHAPAATSRRSMQTAMYRLARSLSMLLGPVLAFTADEAWEYLPGSKEQSVHLAIWQPQGLPADPETQHSWKTLFELREAVLPELEKARQNKMIGKALDAQVALGVPATQMAAAQAHAVMLQELLNVSALKLTAVAENAPTVIVEKAAGQKCGRCWHWETDVGADAEYPALCARCAKIVREWPA